MLLVGGQDDGGPGIVHGGSATVGLVTAVVSFVAVLANSLTALYRRAAGLAVEWNGRVFAAAIDPGVRCFAAVYDTRGVAVKLGEWTGAELFSRYTRQIDKLTTEIALPGKTCKQRMAMRRRIVRLRYRADQALRSALSEYANFLTRTYRVVFLPDFRVASMVAGSPLGRTTSRDMLASGHGRFKRLLLEKGARNGCTVIIVRANVTVTALCVCVCLLVACLLLPAACRWQWLLIDGTGSHGRWCRWTRRGARRLAASAGVCTTGWARLRCTAAPTLTAAWLRSGTRSLLRTSWHTGCRCWRAWHRSGRTGTRS